MARKHKFRAIRWGRCSDDTQPVGPWCNSKCEALTYAYSRYMPHERYFYEIERSDGRRVELTDRQYENAETAYHHSMAIRDITGVWG